MQRSLFAIILAICLAWSVPAAAQALVNLNTAGQSELTGIKGVGPAKAQAIVDYREKHGPFKGIEDLDKVKGFGPKTVEKIAPHVTVGAAAPARKQRSQ
jgi:competence protein ComEA